MSDNQQNNNGNPEKYNPPINAPTYPAATYTTPPPYYNPIYPSNYNYAMNTNYLAANPNSYPVQTQIPNLPNSPYSYGIQQPQVFTTYPNGTAPPPPPVGLPMMPVGNAMSVQVNPRLSHKLEKGFRSTYIKGVTNLNERYSLYESRIRDINEICEKHNYLMLGWMRVAGVVLIAASIVIFITRQCVADPYGMEQTCSGSGPSRKCVNVTCKIPFQIPIAALLAGIFLGIGVASYIKIVIGRLVADLQTKLGEINQADSHSYGVTWTLRTEVTHRRKSTETTHFIDLFFK